MNSQYTIAIVSSVALYREGVKASLDSRPDMRVRGSVGSLSEALTAAQASKVDLCVTDIFGFERASVDYFFLGMARLDVPVVVIGLPRQSEAAIACLEAGASGYVTREASLAELHRVMYVTLEKGACVDDEDLQALVHQLQCNAQTRRSGRAQADPRLTERERQIAALLTENRTNAEIAHHLGISVHTVKHHVRSTLLKLGMDRRSEIVAHRDFVSRLLDGSC